MISKAINNVPTQGRMNVIQAGIFNMNMRLLALARQKLAIVNKDNNLFAVPEGIDEESTFTPHTGGAGTFQFGKHIDGANALDERDRSADGSADVLVEQGHEAPVDPMKQAEQFVSLRDMLVLKYLDEANKARRRPMDMSFASVINWMHNRDFIPNNNEASAVFMASRGRVSLDQAIAAQKKRHEDEKARIAKIAEPLLATMEDFSGLDLCNLLGTETPQNEDGDTVIDTIFDSLPSLTRLGVLNVMWRRCRKLVVEDFPSKRVPTNDFASDIALAIASEDEFLALAKITYDAAHDDYDARIGSGLPGYDVVNEIKRLAKSAAQAKAKALATPAGTTAAKAA